LSLYSVNKSVFLSYVPRRYIIRLAGTCSLNVYIGVVKARRAANTCAPTWLPAGMVAVPVYAHAFQGRNGVVVGDFATCVVSCWSVVTIG